MTVGKYITKLEYRFWLILNHQENQTNGQYSLCGLNGYSYKFIQILAAIILLSSCVQKAYKKTVIATLTVKNKRDIKNVEVYGDGNPLSWYNGLKLTEVIKDSVYTATIQTVTGFKSTELKFKIDDEFELKDQPNRILTYSEGSDSTFLNVVFDENEIKK